MFIKSWEYGFEGDGVGVYLFCKFNLKCPNCGNIFVFKASAYDTVSNIRTLASYYIENINEDALSCENCGAQSMVPKQDRLKFGEELHYEVTPELIGQALRARLNKVFKPGRDGKRTKADRSYIDTCVSQYVEAVRAENLKEPD